MECLHKVTQQQCFGKRVLLPLDPPDGCPTSVSPRRLPGTTGRAHPEERLPGSGCTMIIFLSVQGESGHGKGPSIRQLRLRWAVVRHFRQMLCCPCCRHVNKPEEVPCTDLGQLSRGSSWPGAQRSGPRGSLAHPCPVRGSYLFSSTTVLGFEG